MKRRAAVTAIVAVIGGASITAAQATGTGTPRQARSTGVKGTFSLQAMAHTSTAQSPTLFNVKPWDGRSLGRFSYRAIPCSGNAPVNNISSDLPSYGTRVAGSRSPSSTRLHNLSFRVAKTSKGTEMLGKSSIVVCQLKSGPTQNPDPVSDEVKPRIRITWRATFDPGNPETIPFRGTFKIVGGTQRYEDLTGTGTIAGYLFCFAPAGCANSGGKYLDAQLSMQGDYADPTPQL